MSSVSGRIAGQPVHSEIDLEAPGKHLGYLRLPHSVHRSAYGWLPYPIASIRNGEGPTVVVMAGNHGDEYEGQIIVSRLIREVDPEMLTGQLILLPMANFPAAEAGLRTSPIDGGNLNRSFPGDPAGPPTDVIAHYIEHELLPRAQLVVDLHAGGSSLQYHGTNLLTSEPRDDEERERVFGWIRAFGLQRACIRQTPNPVTIQGAARRQGSWGFLAELGGAGTVTPEILREAWQGVRNLLAHVGVLHGPLVPVDGAPHETRFMRINGEQHHVYTHDAGVFEPLVELGDFVAAGQPAARIHFPQTPGQAPVEIAFEAAGQVICKRVPALVRRGDCLLQLAGDR